MKKAFKFSFIGLLIGSVLLIFGYYLKKMGAKSDIYMLFGNSIYFYSGMVFIVSSIALLILGSNKNKGGALADERKALSDLQDLSWKDFNDYITGLFEKMGYSLAGKGGLNEKSMDIQMKRDGRLSIVRCRKYYVRNVPLSMVLEFHKSIIREPDLEKGYFITTGFFSREARKFASEKKIELIDGARLIDFVRTVDSIDAAKENPALKNSPNMAGYKCPKCGAQMVLRTVAGNPHTVTNYWGCSAYPACKGALRSEQANLSILEH